MKRHITYCFVILLCLGQINAQEILPVQNNPQEEIIRRQQLALDSSRYLLSDRSLMVRPVSLQKTKFTQQGFTVKPLPFQQLTEYNLNRPFAYANGALLPNKGWQFYYTTGVEVRSPNFVFRFQPEYVWAFNGQFEGFPSGHDQVLWNSYYNWLNKIDLPERFSAEPIRKFYPGLSRAQLMLGPLAIGYSTENLWWGPGRFSSLVMSNNAPGFEHGTFHSEEPIKTPIGTFEFDYVWAGRLKSSGELPPETNRAYNNIYLYQPKLENRKRFFTGGVLSWQPKWLKGLFVGFDAASLYYETMPTKRSNMGSLMGRYILPAEKAEVYMQYGRSDKFTTAWNVFQDTIPRGFLAGIRKMFPLSNRVGQKKNPAYLQLGIEMVQLQVPNVSLIRQTKSWYTSDLIRQGFTNEGQVLGAPIGPGSNTQRLEIAWVKGASKIGLEVERWLHNADFYYHYNITSGSMDYNRQWVDLSSSLVWNFPYRHWQWFGQFSVVRSINYQWFALIPGASQGDAYFDNGLDEINVHGRFGLLYTWK